MRERKITINTLDNGFTARLIERPYGGTHWILSEEYDVTAAIKEACAAVCAPLIEEIERLKRELAVMEQCAKEFPGDG